MSEKRVKHYIVEWTYGEKRCRMAHATRKEAWRYYWSLTDSMKDARVIRVVAKPRRDIAVETLKWCYALCENTTNLNSMATAIEGRLRILGAWEDEQ